MMITVMISIYFALMPSTHLHPSAFVICFVVHASNSEESNIFQQQDYLGKHSKKNYGNIWEFFPTWGGGSFQFPKPKKVPLNHPKNMYFHEVKSTAHPPIIGALGHTATALIAL